jgi:medium-chain acyl-[acyl-carrier-protein] hydrolase
MVVNDSALIYIPKPNPSALIRLVCFPYAGGSSSTYLSWQRYFHTNIEIAVVQLPGRGIRSLEKPYESMAELVKHVFLAMEKLPFRPSIFFGHSMGACVAYEVTLMLHRFGYPLPFQFVASGSIAPCVSRTKLQTYSLPDDEFVAKISELNGSSKEVLQNCEMMQYILPALRADFKIIETYRNRSRFAIPTRVCVIAGEDDEIALPEIEAWFTLFDERNDLKWVSGGHFFIDTNRDAVLKVLSELIEGYLNSP